MGIRGHDFGCSCLFKEQSLEFSSQSGPRSVNRENKSFWPRGRRCWKVQQPQQDQNCTWLSLGQKEKRESGNTQLTLSEVRGVVLGNGRECFSSTGYFTVFRTIASGLLIFLYKSPMGQLALGKLSLREVAFLRLEASLTTLISVLATSPGASLFISRCQCQGKRSIWRTNRI